MTMLKRKKEQYDYWDRLCELLVNILRVREKRKRSREDYMNDKIKQRQYPREEQEAAEKGMNHFHPKAVSHVSFSEKWLIKRNHW